MIFLVQEEFLDADDLADDLRLLIDLIGERLKLLSLVVFFFFPFFCIIRGVLLLIFLLLVVIFVIIIVTVAVVARRGAAEALVVRVRVIVLIAVAMAATAVGTVAAAVDLALLLGDASHAALVLLNGSGRGGGRRGAAEGRRRRVAAERGEEPLGDAVAAVQELPRRVGRRHEDGVLDHVADAGAGATEEVAPPIQPVGHRRGRGRRRSPPGLRGKRKTSPRRQDRTPPTAIPTSTTKNRCSSLPASSIFSFFLSDYYAARTGTSTKKNPISPARPTANQIPPNPRRGQGRITQPINRETAEEQEHRANPEGGGRDRSTKKPASPSLAPTPRPRSLTVSTTPTPEPSPAQRGAAVR